MARKQDVFGVTIDGDISGLKKAMYEAEKLFKKTESSLNNVNKALQLDPTNVDLLKKKQELLTRAIDEGDKALKNLEHDMDLIRSDPRYISGVTEYTQKYTQLELEAKKVQDRLGKLREEAKSMPSAEIVAFGEKFKDLGSTLTDISKKTAGISAVFQKMAKSMLESSIDYESDIAQIKRVASDLSDNTLAELKQIAIETGTAFGDVSEYATFAAALGLVEDEISGFTKNMLNLNVATGNAFGGEEGAKKIVVFLKNLGLAIDETENFGSAIAIVGDKYADIGSETLDVATSLAGLATVAKVDQYDLIGLAGVMADLGLTSEASSSSITRSFIAIDNAILKGGAGLQALAETSGMTTKEFKENWGKDTLNTFLRFADGLQGSVYNQINDAIDTSNEKVKEFSDTLGWSAEYFVEMWGNDPQKIFNQYIESLGELGEDGESAIGVLKDVKLSSVRTVQTLLRLAGSGNEVRDAIKLANQAWNENTALTDKANGIYDTTEKKIAGMKEALRQLGASFTDNILPYIKKGIDFLTDLIERFASLDTGTQNLILSFITLGASFSGITGFLGKLNTGLGNILTTGSILKTLLSGTGGVVALVAALAGGIGYLAIKASEAKTPLGTVRQEVNDLKDSYKAFLDTINKNIEEKEFDLLVTGKNIDEISEYVDLICKVGVEEEKEAKYRKKINDLLEETNQKLGTDYYFDYDEGFIKNQQGEIIELTNKYKELAEEIRRTFYIEQYASAYEEALKQQKMLQDERAQALIDYNEKVQESSVDVEYWLDLMNNNHDEFSRQVSNMSQTEREAVGNAIAAYTNFNGILNDIDTQMLESQQTIETYNALLEGTPEEVSKAIDAIRYGILLDPTKADLEEIEHRIEDINTVLEHPEGFNASYLEELETQKTALEEELERRNELKDAIEDYNQTVIESNDLNRQDVENTYNEIENANQDTKNAIDKYNNDTNRAYLNKQYVDFTNMGQEIIDWYASHPATLTVNTQYVGNSFVPSATTWGQRHGVVRQSNSGGINVKASFNIHSNNISQDTVKGWGYDIASAIDEALGQEL